MRSAIADCLDFVDFCMEVFRNLNIDEIVPEAAIADCLDFINFYMELFCTLNIDEMIPEAAFPS